MFCGNCGVSLISGDGFCRGCGASAELVDAAQAPAGDAAAGPAADAAPAVTGPVVSQVAGGSAGVMKVLTMASVIGASAVVAAGSLYYFVIAPPDSAVAPATVTGTQTSITIEQVTAAPAAPVAAPTPAAVAVTDPAGPTGITQKFVRAVDEKDLNTAMSCLDPKYDMAYQGSSNIFGDIVGVELSDLADLFPALFSISGSVTGDKTDYSMKIVNIASENMQGESATVVALVDVSEADAAGKLSSSRENATFHLKKFNDGWRIVDVK